MEMDLIGEGVKFMILGMGTVFLFLILMIVTLQFQAYIIQKFFPQAVKPKKSSSSNRKDDKQVVAAIVGAISAYKK